MVFFCKAVLTDVLVIALGFKIGWVQIKKAHGAVILPDELLKILIFNDHLCQSAMRLFNKGKI